MSIKLKVIISISIILFVALAALAVGCFYLHTDGFQQSPQLFYIRCEGQRIYSDTMGNAPNKALTFEVRYPLWIYKGFDYDVEPLQDFTFTVDGEVQNWGDIDSFKGFLDEKQEDGKLTVNFAKSVEDVLKAMYGKDTQLCEEIPTGDLFKLTFKSYGEKVTVSFGFTLKSVIKIEGIKLNIKEVAW